VRNTHVWLWYLVAVVNLLTSLPTTTEKAGRQFQHRRSEEEALAHEEFLDWQDVPMKGAPLDNSGAGAAHV